MVKGLASWKMASPAGNAAASRLEFEARIKKAESALSALQKEYEQVLHHNSHGIRIINQDYTVRLINQIFAQMSGISPEEAVGKKCYEIFPGPFCHTPDCRLKRILDGDSSLQAQIERIKPDGRPIPCVVNVAPFRDEKGKLAGVIETFTDVTERLRLEGQVKESEERFQALVELGANTGEAIVILQDLDGIEGRYIFVNDLWSKIAGYSREELLNMSAFDLITPDQAGTARMRYRNILAGKVMPKLFEGAVTSKNGERIPVELTIAPIKYQGKNSAVVHLRDINERKRLESKAWESEARYRALVDLGTEAGEAIVMLQDLDGKEGLQAFVSEQWVKITGYSRDELLSMLFFDLLHPADRKASLARHRLKMSGKPVPGLYEVTLMRKDGVEVPIELTGAFTTYKGRRANVLYLRDISERKSMEKEMRESEDRCQALIHLGTEANEAVVMLEDVDGWEEVHAFASDQWVKLTGYSQKELNGMTFRELLHPADRKASLARHRLKMSGKPVPGLYEVTLMRKDGVEVPIELTGAFTTYRGRRVTVNYIRDITERKQAEEKVRQAETKIRESEERYRSLFEDVPVAIYELDYSDVKKYIDKRRAEGISDFETHFLANWREFEYCFNLRRVIGLNKAVVSFLGADSKEEVEAKIQQHLESRPTGLQRDMQNIVALTRGALRISYQSHESDFKGKWRDLNTRFAIAPGHEENWSRVFLSFWDITELVQAENELKRYQGCLEEMVEKRTAQLSGEIERRVKVERILKDMYSQELKLRKQLEEHNKQRTEFTRALVHEIKTPLTSVMAASDLLQAECREEPHLSLAKHIFEGAMELNARTDELFDLARGELGLLKLARNETNLVELIGDVLRTIEPVLCEKGLELESDIDSTLPAAWVDGTRLRQVLLNILNNAMKYTPGGGRIKLSAANIGTGFHVEIRDSGQGISKEDQEWVFEPYHRLRKDGVSYGGLGLGLSISKRLVELHSGRIWIESEKGRGTTVHIHIPLEANNSTLRNVA